MESVSRAALAMAFLVMAGTGVQADGLQAGFWQIISNPENNGVAAPQMQNMRCLTADDVKDLDRTFSPVSRTTNSTCERTEHESTPQRLKWRLQCTGQLDMDVAGEFLFDSPDHYTATVTVRSSILGRVLNDARTAIDGRRVGDCP